MSNPVCSPAQPSVQPPPPLDWREKSFSNRNIDVDPQLDIRELVSQLDKINNSYFGLQERVGTLSVCWPPSFCARQPSNAFDFTNAHSCAVGSLFTIWAITEPKPTCDLAILLMPAAEEKQNRELDQARKDNQEVTSRLSRLDEEIRQHKDQQAKHGVGLTLNDTYPIIRCLPLQQDTKKSEFDHNQLSQSLSRLESALISRIDNVITEKERMEIAHTKGQIAKLEEEQKTHRNLLEDYKSRLEREVKTTVGSHYHSAQRELQSQLDEGLENLHRLMRDHQDSVKSVTGFLAAFKKSAQEIETKQTQADALQQESHTELLELCSVPSRFSVYTATKTEVRQRLLEYEDKYEKAISEVHQSLFDKTAAFQTELQKHWSDHAHVHQSDVQALERRLVDMTTAQLDQQAALQAKFEDISDRTQEFGQKLHQVDELQDQCRAVTSKQDVVENLGRHSLSLNKSVVENIRTVQKQMVDEVKL
eukprot:gene9826-32_t